MNWTEAEAIEQVAMAIYCDSYTQYGTCTPEHWAKTSETQRAFCRGQAAAALAALRRAGWLR